jgi:PKD domain
MKNIYLILFNILLLNKIVAQCAYTSFRYEPDYDGCGIRFIDQSAGNGTRIWDFGDGQSKTIQGNASTLHRYANNGTYKVTLTQDGAKATQQVTVAKCGVAASATIPDCTIMGSDYVAAGATVTYQASVIGGQAPYTYEWNVSGAATLSSSNSASTNVTIPEFDKNGDTYKLTLVVKDTNNTRALSNTKTLKVSGNVPRLKLFFRGNTPGKPIQITAIDKTGNLSGLETAWFTIGTDPTRVLSGPGFQYFIDKGLLAGSYNVCISVEAPGNPSICEPLLVGTVPPTPAALQPTIIPSSVEVNAGEYRQLKVNNLQRTYYTCGAAVSYELFWSFTNPITKKTYQQYSTASFNSVSDKVEDEGVNFSAGAEDIGNWDVEITYCLTCGKGKCDPRSTQGKISEKNKINVSYKAIQFDNVTETPNCTSPQLTVNHSSGAPKSGAFKTYTWRAFAIEGKGGELLGFFKTNNAKTVTINKDHDYFKRYRAGDKPKVLCDITVTDYLDVVRTFNYVADMTLPLRMDADKLQSCSGTTGVATMPKVVVGGIAPYTYSWVDAADTKLRDFAVNKLYPTTPITTDATLRVTDSKGCTVDKLLNISVNNPIVITPLKQKITLCSSVTVARQLDDLFTVSGGTGNYRYRWSPADKLDNAYIPNPKIKGDNASLAGVVFYLSVSDDGGCYAESAFPVGDVVKSGTVVSNIMDATVCYGIEKTIGFIVAKSSTTSDYQYKWTSTNPIFNAIADNTAIKDVIGSTFKLPFTKEMANAPGKYDFKLWIKETDTGCATEKLMTVTVQNQWKLQGFEVLMIIASLVASHHLRMKFFRQLIQYQNLVRLLIQITLHLLLM